MYRLGAGIHTTNPTFKKTFLLHTLNAPTVTADNSSFGVTAGDGALSGRVLLPVSVSATVVGGAGGAYQAGGQNWPPEIPNKSTGVSDQYSISGYGAGYGVSGLYRLEISPSVPKVREHSTCTVTVRCFQRCFLAQTAQLPRSASLTNPVACLRGAGRRRVPLDVAATRRW